jgi:hypothetical protein
VAGHWLAAIRGNDLVIASTIKEKNMVCVSQSGCNDFEDGVYALIP